MNGEGARRDRPLGIDERLKAGDLLAGFEEADGRDLNDPVHRGRQAGGFEVECDELANRPKPSTIVSFNGWLMWTQEYLVYECLPR